MTPTPHPTQTATPTETPTAPPLQCVGDCDGGGAVTVDEIIVVVNIALGDAPASSCPHGVNPVEPVTVVEIQLAIINALDGCPPH